MILDTSLLKIFFCPFGRFEHDTRHKSIEDIFLPFWKVRTWYSTQVYWRHFFALLEGLNMILDTSLMTTFLCPFRMFEHDTEHKSIEDISLALRPLSFVWTLVLSFFFFSCSLAGCFSFIYLFIYWWQVSQESWFKSNSYCILFYWQKTGAKNEGNGD